jgi:hypothetical protein
MGFGIWFYCITSQASAVIPPVSVDSSSNTI